MKIKDLQKFAKKDHKRVGERLGLGKNELILAHAVKLGEELGELNEEVLKNLKCQMRDKPIEENGLEHELADVIIVASVLGIDIEKALKEKMEKVDKRFE